MKDLVINVMDDFRWLIGHSLIQEKQIIFENGHNKITLYYLSSIILIGDGKCQPGIV